MRPWFCVNLAVSAGAVSIAAAGWCNTGKQKLIYAIIADIIRP